MLNLTTKTVREIALEMPITTRVFEEFKIDYCCGGRKPFLEACRNVGANPEAVLEKIGAVLETSQIHDFDWLKDSTLIELIRYIERVHHTYTKDELASLPPLMAKVANRHGENHKELAELQGLFDELCSDLAPHLTKEEDILFPYIEQLERSEDNSGSAPMSCFGTVQNPIRMMTIEHDTVGDILKRMRAVSSDYTLPEGACPSYTALFDRLESFERDLHQHIHLENNLLFPRAIELEQRIFA